MGKFLLWLSLSFYLYFTYHLLVKPVVLEYSLIGVLIVTIVLILFFLALKKSDLRKVTVYSFLILFADLSLFNLKVWHDFRFYFGSIVLILVVLTIAKWVGKLEKPALLALIISLIFVGAFDRSVTPLFTKFIPLWISPTIYAGETVDFFPYLIRDVDNDRKMEIVTLGNIEEVKKRIRENNEEDLKAKSDYKLKDEELFLYIYKWEKNKMVRIANDRLPAKLIQELKIELNAGYSTFPYFLSENNTLHPLVDRQSLTEEIMGFNNLFYRTVMLDLTNIAQVLSEREMVISSLKNEENHSAYRNLMIKNGELTFSFNGKEYVLPTTATKIVGIVQLPEEKSGILILGKSLEIISLEPNGVAKTLYRLGEEKVPAISTAEVLTSDIDHDQIDEIMLSFPTTPENRALILKPTNDGNWDILWKAKNEIFRFETIWHNPVTKKAEIIGLNNNYFGVNNIRFLESFSYNNYTLESNWKAFRSFINIKSGDVDGDGKEEIVGSSYKTHQLFLLKPHQIPVTLILTLLTFALLIILLVRRVRHAK